MPRLDSRTTVSAPLTETNIRLEKNAFPQRNTNSQPAKIKCYIFVFIPLDNLPICPTISIADAGFSRGDIGQKAVRRTSSSQ